MAINRDTLRIEAALHAALTGTTNAQTRAIVEAWALAWDEVAAHLEAALLDLTSAAQDGRVTRTMVLRSARAQAALRAVAEALDRVAARTGTIITADLRQVIDTAMTAETDMVATQLTGTRRADLAANLVRADPAQVEAMIARATQQITATTLPLGAEATAAMRRELLRGIAVGDNPRAAARRMLRSVEDRFNGGLSRAMTIARTEMLDAHRTAAQTVDRANADVVAGWTWVAHLGPRTCPSCIAMHGTVHDIEDPGPNDHQNGRCARVPRTRTWAELGFPGIKDPPDLTPDADAWFRSLSADQQRGILGDKGFEAWQAGKYPRTAWTTTRHTDGWRDSQVPSRPPAA